MIFLTKRHSIVVIQVIFLKCRPLLNIGLKEMFQLLIQNYSHNFICLRFFLNLHSDISFVEFIKNSLKLSHIRIKICFTLKKQLYKIKF